MHLLYHADSEYVSYVEVDRIRVRSLS